MCVCLCVLVSVCGCTVDDGFCIEAKVRISVRLFNNITDMDVQKKHLRNFKKLHNIPHRDILKI